MKRLPASIIPMVLVLTISAGCSGTAGTSSGDEKQVRQAFTALQEALKAKDAEKIWGLLDADGQADAESRARAVRDAYAKASPAEKAKQEKQLGLPGKELSTLKGIGYLKTRLFLGKHHEIPDSEIEKVTVQGDQATVFYVEEDGDHEKLKLVREGGKWKVSNLDMPKP